MSQVAHLKELGGLPAFDFPATDEERELPEAGAVAWRVRADEHNTGETWSEAYARFTAAVDTRQVRALIVGVWEETYEISSAAIVSTLAGAAADFPDLRSLFLGDIEGEESEISWIQQGDVTPLLEAFPALREFGVRGGEGLVLAPVKHPELRRLVVETGGLPREVVRGIAASDLPALEVLDLWLGTSEYGADTEPEDLEPILSGARLPALRHLALRNSEIQDAVAVAVAGAPVVARLETLDLSMGILTDEGAAALLAGRPLTHLKRLDLDHHFIGVELQERLRAALEPHGVELALAPGEEDEYDGEIYRYVAVSE
ncbi:STM4015 family protein [Streptomyces sp. NPDC048258]|uniref:STM4015 family protein n=1 Tax=Streptomyces sp. NPDC048258 TaxID=3365527 RepID=UPI00371B943A